MKIQACLGLKEREMVCAVGGGGKTTLLFTLAKELLNTKQRVILTTTTKIYFPQGEDVITLVEHENSFANNPRISREKLTVWGSNIIKLPKERDKLAGVGCGILDELYSREVFDYILVEADGAKRKSLKAPNEYEPCIPEKATTVLGVIGVDVVGKKLNNDNFHRADIFLKSMPFVPNSIIDTDVIAALVHWENGLFKNTPSTAQKVLVLNKVDNLQMHYIAEKIAQRILIQKSGITPDKVIFTSFLYNPPIIEVFL